ncbi:MAG: hypothetical protein R2774_01670 [Saprospiraceae bacterium]
MTSSQNAIPKKEWIYALLILIFFIVAVFYKVIQHPNYFLVPNGDGMKNYFTFMYHVHNDSTYMTFEGMNYPFGENIIFTDNQPLLANTVKVISKVFPSLLCQLPAIHNLSLLLGIIFGGLGLFLCFRLMKIEFLFSLFCTLGLILLNPQILRFNGHFSMFYPILPWLFYFWIQIWQSKNVVKLSIPIAVIITLSGLLHMYYFITGAIFALLSIGIYVLSSHPQIKWWDSIKAVMIQVVMPFAILTFFSSYFNHASDRPNEPWGFFSYHSSWEGLLFSYCLPLYEFINNNIVKVRTIDFEGRNYVGLAGVLTILLGLYYLVFRYRVFKQYFEKGSLKMYLFLIFILTVFISFGLPFTIPGLGWLLDYTGPFKQFRSIGRVGWVSFYAINLLGIPMIYQWLKSRDAHPFVMYSIPAIIVIEGLLFHHALPSYQTKLDSYYCDSKMNLSIDHTAYQATLSDPYFNIGSEGFSWWDQAENVNQAFKIGYNLQLPSMAVNMSRTSLKHALLLNEMVNQPIKVPEIIHILKQKSMKPILVIESKQPINDTRARLSHWTKNSPIVYENDEIKLRKLELSDFDQIVKQYRDSIDTIIQVIPKFSKSLQFEKIKGSTGWGFEAYIEKEVLVPGDYLLSYQLECPDATYVLSNTEVWQFDKLDAKVDYIGEANRFNYKQIDGNTLRIEIPIHVKESTTKIAIKVSKFNQKKNNELIFSNVQFKSLF